ncbi:MAG: O-acetylhomoserine aminocarboxypropyltransferase/cysteine synthase, partial [Bacteroidales bacterium]|nr:O-acetylhomoserine aminocarboxypropyltransferase/cysteine synthase [Bacteroidales bacterium]
MENKRRLGTLCVQAGWTPGNGEPRVLPIIQSTTFKYENSEEMALLFDLKKDGYFYTRLQNPTNDAVAAKIAALEGGVGAVLTSSGQAANFYAVFNICEAGGHIVVCNGIYGGTFNLFGVTLKKLGIDCTFIDPHASEEELSAAFRPNTKALFGETITNPGCNVLDIERFAHIAHAHGVPLIVDNTFATPINCRPFEWGADIVTHSTTKYMDGHATCVGGVIVDSGNFDWMAHADKFPGLTTPDESYHGLTYATAFGKMAYITKATAQLMRDLGSIPSPQNAFLLNLGLETLHLRMQRHCENAQKVAEWLEANPKVKWVNYCGLKSSPYYELTQKYMPNGSCGVIAFGLHGTREEAIRFMDSLKLACIVTHVADA